MTRTEERPEAARPAPRRRRRWLRRVGIALVVLALLVAAAPFALSVAPVRRFVAERISDSVGRRVTIGGLTARWWSGVEIRDLEVHNPAGFTGEPLVSVDRAHADVGFLSLVGGTVDVEVSVERPVVTLLRGPREEWNSDGLPKERPDRREREASDPPRFRVTVRDGVVVSRPGSGEPEQRLDGIDLSATRGADGVTDVSFRAVARGAGPDGADATVEATVRVDAAGDGRIRAEVPRLSLARVSGVVAAGLGAEAVAGTASAKVDLAVSGGVASSGSARLDLADASLWIRGGTVTVRSVEASFEPVLSPEGSRFDLAVRVADLRAEGFSEGGEALVEPSLTLVGSVLRETDGDVVFGTAGKGLALRGSIVSGSLSGTLPGDPARAADFAGDLSLVLSPTLGRLAGLVRDPGGTLTGTLRLEARATSSAAGSLEWKGEAEAKDLVFAPDAPSTPWREPLAKASFAATKTAEGLTVSSASVRAGALEASLGSPFVLRRGADGALAWESGRLEAVADLARARSILTAFAGLAPDTSVAGSADATLVVRRDGGGTRVLAKGGVSGFRWAPAGGPPLSEPRVELEADVRVDPRAGRHEVSKFSLVAGASRITASGSLGPDGAIDLRSELSGDGAALAPRLRALLGEAYSDLTAEGPLSGKATIRRAPAPEGAAPGPLLVDADVALPKTASGGITVEEGRLTARRSAAADPLAVTLAARVNGGTLSSSGSCDLAREGTPWSGRAEIRGLDTSPIVVGKGPGRFLPMLLPAIVPGGVERRVLSGRLDADLSLDAHAAGSRPIADALRGNGRLDMKQGSVAESTLFTGLSADRGLGRLVALVPAVGERFRALGQSLLFTEMTSRFDLAQRVVRLHEVRLVSDSLSIRFSGEVGFDGSMDLSVPVTLRGDAGESVSRFLKDGVIPVRVTGKVGALRVLPDLRGMKVAEGAIEGLLEKGKGLFGR